MVGSYNLHASGMRALNDLFDDLISGESLDVDQVDETCLRCGNIQLRVVSSLNRLLAALFGCAEGKEDGSIAQSSTQVFQNILNLGEIKDALEPVDTPLDEVQTDFFKGSGSGQNLFFCHADDGNDDLRNTFTDLDAADFDYVTHIFLLSEKHNYSP